MLRWIAIIAMLLMVSGCSYLEKEEVIEPGGLPIDAEIDEEKSNGIIDV